MIKKIRNNTMFIGDESVILDSNDGKRLLCFERLYDPGGESVFGKGVVDNESIYEFIKAVEHILEEAVR